MAEKPNGGPAFPRSDAGYSPTQDGMSLRDWLAGQALSGMLAATCEYGELDQAYIEQKTTSAAESAYRVADAMLEARGK